MKTTEYKNEVNALTLSDEFKQALKEKMLEAKEGSPAPDPITKKSTAVFSAKYSRYIALAACLLLVISTVGVVSISGLISAKGSESVNDEIQNGLNENDPDRSSDSNPYNVGDDGSTSPDDNNGSDTDNSNTDPVGDVPGGNTDVPVVTAPPEDDTPNPDPDPDPEQDNGNGYSIYASPEYDGSYIGEDYIIANYLGPADITADTILPAAEYTFEELTSGQSYGYYDIRDRVIAKLDGVALIRFSIEDSYIGDNEISRNVNGTVTVNTARQTLYKIKITQEYLSNVSVSAERLLINDGNDSFQLAGRPLMTGEYLALVYENDDGVLVPLPQLVYAVHRVNRLDLAYHVYSDDGFEVDPGSTNMGLMPEERKVVTSTNNNPEVYTHKAAVKELTYYIRRNLQRLNLAILDVENDPRSGIGTDGGTDNTEPPEGNNDQSEDINYRSKITANYPTGSLKVSYEGDAVKVNGIGVGDSMEDARIALRLTKYYFTPDAVMTLNSSEEDGKWQVIIRFSENIVTAIEVKE